MTYRLGENIQREWDEEPRGPALWEALQLFKSNPERAVTELQDLAEGGSALAMMYLGHALGSGRGGIEADRSLGRQWLSRSAESGSIEGGFGLALNFLRAEEFERAEDEFIKLCARGYSPAMYRLGILFYCGHGGERDLAKGMHYFSMAERAGHLHARHWLSNIYLTQNLGLTKKMQGLWKRVLLLVPFVKFMVTYPTSDRLRSASAGGWMANRLDEYKKQHGIET